MAYENINITKPNFCFGPKIGTYCFVDTSGVSAILRIRNSGGVSVAPHAIDFYPNDVIKLDADAYPKNVVKWVKYVGPTSLSDFFDNLSFYTLERYTLADGTSTECTIRRWIMNAVNNRLELDNSIVKSSGDDYNFDCSTLCLEYVSTTFQSATDSGTGYVVVSSTSNIEIGNRIMLGPSTDVMPLVNTNGIEYAIVDNVIGDNVYVTASGYTAPYFQYQVGDSITVFKDMFLFSNLPETGVDNKGALYRIDSNTGAVVEVDNSGVYYNIAAAEWSTQYDAIAFVNNNNLIFVDDDTFSTTGSYRTISSLVMDNVNSDEYTALVVYALLLDGTTVYRLQNAVTKIDDSGNKTTSTWTSTYNYVLDTMSQYTASVTLYSSPTGIIKPGETVTLTAIVRNQFGGALQNKNVVFYKSGDSTSFFTPTNGQDITDINGIATVSYTAGVYAVTGNVYQGFDGLATITVRSDGGYVGHGSQYIWDRIYLPTNGSYYSEGNTFISQLPTLYGGTPSVSWPIYTEYNIKQVVGFEVDLSLINKSKFCFPGGNWIYNIGADTDYPPIDTTTIVRQTHFPMLHIKSTGVTSILVDTYLGQYHGMYQRNNTGTPGTNVYKPEKYVRQLLSDSDFVQFSQTYLSRHLSSGASVTTELDQFVFVVDAVPGFWSEKNPTITNIWIKLAPFADSLVSGSLVFRIRESYFGGDTGWYDIANQGTITTYDAGGGLLGVEFYWENPSRFHNNATIYVHVEILDTFGNLIFVEYWFKIVPDYRAPYVENLIPDRESFDIPNDTDISFTIKDTDVGVDINSLLLFVNGSRVTPNINKIDINTYNIEFNPTKDFVYGQTVEVSIKVGDLSEPSNVLYDMWRFYCAGSVGPWFDPDSFMPLPCSFGVNLKNTDVSFNVYGLDDSGVDRESIVLFINGVKRNAKIVPILYRLT